MPAYCLECFASGPWPPELEGLCDDCARREEDALGLPTLSELLAANPTDFPRFEEGRLVWACCVSPIGSDCCHKITA